MVVHTLLPMLPLFLQHGLHVAQRVAQALQAWLSSCCLCDLFTQTLARFRLGRTTFQPIHLASNLAFSRVLGFLNVIISLLLCRSRH